jgi:hypothetical protein
MPAQHSGRAADRVPYASESEPKRVFCSLLRHLHGQAEPVPEKPDPLTAGPPDQFFGLSQLSGVRQDGSCQIRGPGSAWALLQAGDYIPGWPVPL